MVSAFNSISETPIKQLGIGYSSWDTKWTERYRGQSRRNDTKNKSRLYRYCEAIWRFTRHAVYFSLAHSEL